MSRRFLGIVYLCILADSSTALAQIISPGALSRPHAELEGVGNCLKCHERGRDLSPAKCLSCHTLQKERISRREGFHGRMSKAQQQQCETCHHEHLGKQHDLIDWGPGGRTKFDHRKTGFPLRGEHRKINCDQCHTWRLVRDKMVLQRIEAYPAKKTYLGLGSACVNCHFDEHRGQTTKNCQTCHTEVRWKPPQKFRHDEKQTSFALEGEHRRVACGKCHPTLRDSKTPSNAFPRPASSNYLQFKNIPHAECSSCHDDPHRGSFGPSCSKCHTPTGWKGMKTGVRDTGFHDKYRYPLRGKHATTPCRSCHGPFPGAPVKYKGLAFGQCTDCHYDSHLRQFKYADAKGPRCESCHTVQGFDFPGYEIEDHEETDFPLQGAHVAVACERCHTEDPGLRRRIPQALASQLNRQGRPPMFVLTRFQLNKQGKSCEECHQDEHNGQFSRQRPPKRCATCHVDTSFHTLNFDHDKDSKYPLTDSHKEVACDRCHQPRTDTRGNETVIYRPLPKTCESCHQDVHAGQFAKPRSRTAIVSWQDTQCARCHTTKGFKDTLFDHNDPKWSDFPLRGMHASLECGKCHTTVQVTDGSKSVHIVRYKPLPSQCLDCHTDHHRGKLRGVPK